jgi:hypothetical protein
LKIKWRWENSILQRQLKDAAFLAAQAKRQKAALTIDKDIMVLANPDRKLTQLGWL